MPSNFNTILIFYKLNLKAHFIRTNSPSAPTRSPPETPHDVNDLPDENKRPKVDFNKAIQFFK